MDSEKGNRVFARGHNVPPPPPWFLEPQKSLVWIGLKLTSFRAILAVRMHAAVRAEGLLAPSSTRFSVDKRCRLCKGLGSLLSYPLLVATLCFNPAEGPQMASRSAECRGRATTYTGAGSISTHTWRATERRFHFDSPTRTRVNSDSCVNDGYCLRLFSVDTSPLTNFSPFPSWTLPRSTRTMTDSGKLRSSISLLGNYAQFLLSRRTSALNTL